MDKKASSRQWKKLLLIEMFGIAASFLIAILFRFELFYEHMNKGAFDPDFYQLVFLFILVTYAFWVLADNTKGPLPSQQNPLEILVTIFKNQIFLMIVLVLSLFVIHRVDKISRSMIALHLVLNVIIDIPIRFSFAKYLKKLEKLNWKSFNTLLITDAEQAESEIKRIHNQGVTNIKGKQLADLKITSIILSTGDASRLPEQYAKLVKGNISHLPSIERISEVEKIVVGYVSCSEKEKTELIKKLRTYGVPVYTQLYDMGLPIGQEATWGVGGQLVTLYTGMKNKCPVLGVNYTVSNLDEAIHYVRTNRDELSGKYICFSNVHTAVTAYDSPDYMKVQNGAAVIYPDGYPIANEQNRKGFIDAKRVAGPDFMANMFLSTMDGKYSHYFYGGSQETLDALRKRLKQDYPGIKIAGMYSPPFRELTPEEDAADIKKINDSKADFIWVALGAPKQEKWMAAHEGKVNGVMFGIGAAIDFHAGTISRAPKWVQTIGFEWFYRLLQDPKRLIKRYMETNFKFIWLTRILRK